ncbi:hypothetical protein DOY81_014355 [Sarcophaga bullata]|nr:hypothetical protein DOY81_014355 [Sarcophaga bullata]
MMQNEEYLQKSRLTKGASINWHAAVEELANIVLKLNEPIELVNYSGEDNVALYNCSKSPYAVVDDDNIRCYIVDFGSLIIHNEAFVNHANQLKELKFKLSN